jgi:Fe2+ or Zn2+ uptake regulation protein
MPHTLNEAVDRFRRAGLRITRTREALLRMVLDSRRPFSARTLYDRAESAGLAIHLVTVHRNLAEFVQVGIVDKLPGEDNNLYTLHEDTEGGAHVFCLDCRAVVPLDGVPLATTGAVDALSRALSERGFDAATLRLMFSAHCKTHACTHADGK